MPALQTNGGCSDHTSGDIHKDLVLLTGADGFIGTEIALQYMEAGFKVRGTFRSQEKANLWVKAHQFRGLFEAATVKDMAHADAFDYVMEGVSIIVHTASPVTGSFQDPETEMLGPTEAGTRNILHSALLHGPSIRRVIFTGFFGAIWDMRRAGPDTVYTEADWSTITRQEALHAGSTYPALVYCAAKKAAEQAAWEFMKNYRPTFNLVTLCAPMVYGPTRQVLKSVQEISTSLSLVWSIVDAKQLPFSFQTFIDVRDLARLHVLAATSKENTSERYLCAGGHYNDELVADLIRRNLREQAHRLPAYDDQNVQQVGRGHYQIDTSKCAEVFGLSFISAEECFVDTFRCLFELEKQCQSEGV